MSTPGYKALMSEVRLDDIEYDPYGTAMEWLFALAEVTYMETLGHTLPEFVPGPALAATTLREWRSFVAIGDGGSALMDVAEMYWSGELTLADIERAYTVFSRFVDFVKLAGRDY